MEGILGRGLLPDAKEAAKAAVEVPGATVLRLVKSAVQDSLALVGCLAGVQVNPLRPSDKCGSVDEAPSGAVWSNTTIHAISLGCTTRHGAHHSFERAPETFTIFAGDRLRIRKLPRQLEINQHG